jgi:hypothetical protein
VIRRFSQPSFTSTLLLLVATLFGTIVSEPSRLASAAWVPPDSQSPDNEASDATAQEATKWIVWLANNYLPRHYDNAKQWGMQKTVLDGWDFRREGVKLETKRRWKDVNHGNWTKYHLEVRDPQENFKIAIHNVKTLPDGKVQFAANIKAPLDIQGRLSVWQYDIQMISLNADAEADVEVDLLCEVAIKLHPLTFPPDILLQPKVISSEMKLTHFRLNRLSQIGGPMAKRLGEGMEFFLKEKVAEEGVELTTKINRSIDKRRDRLRISGSDWLQSKMKEMFSSPTSE